MKKFFILIYLLTFSSLTNLIAQELPYSSANEMPQKTFIGTRLGLNTFNELNIHIDLPSKSKVGFSGSVGFNYGSRVWPGDNGLFCAAVKPRENLGKNGIIGRIGVYFPWLSYKSKPQKQHIQLMYRQTVAKDVVIDEGCYSGSNSNAFEQYDRYARELGLMYYLDWTNTNFYIGVGAGGGQYRKEFSLTGQFPGTPTEETEKEVAGFFVLDIGFRLGGSIY